ncbi:unnamed protein product [Urochloa humidicola]
MAPSRSPRVVVRDAAAASCSDPNTTFVQADPATFRALVQKLTGAPSTTTASAEKKPPPSPRQEEAAAMTIAQHAPPPRRPKLQERRRAAPARLELARPHPSSASSFYYYHHHGVMQMQHSPVSPMDAYVLAASSPSPLSSCSSMTPSPHSPSCGGGVVVISKEEEEREEKAIASKGFYLHASPRGAAAEQPKLLPLFPVHSPRSAYYYAS